MAIRRLGTLSCVECDAKFNTEEELKKHFHAVNTVGSGVYLLVIPENVNPGTWEAAQAFERAIAGLKTKCPGKNFQFINFLFSSSQSGSGLSAIMAVEIV